MTVQELRSEPGLRGDEDWVPSPAYWEWAANRKGPIHVLDGNPGRPLCGLQAPPTQYVNFTVLGRYGTCPSCTADPRGRLPLTERRKARGEGMAEEAVVSVVVELRCSQEELSDVPAVKRQLDWFNRRVAEMMPVWAAQYREYLDVSFGLKEP